jgi:hypothetical protein
MSTSYHNAANKKTSSLPASSVAQGGKRSAVVLTDNRKPTVQLKTIIIQKKEKQNGLPAILKRGVEQLSGTSMDDVKVHYGSAKPAMLQAHAYAQGTDIHIAPGQEKHLPHEAWHVAQQKQGRVKPTLQLRGRVNVNDDHLLEKEADRMGRVALAKGKDKPVTKG